jgi:hypothetical protein
MIGSAMNTDPYAIRTKQEVADILGVDRSYVYQVEKQALKKLRMALAGFLLDTDSEELRAERDSLREFEDEMYTEQLFNPVQEEMD